MKLQQCMGGWCTRRDKCAHYWAKPTKNVPPADRLCANDGESLKPEPADLHEEAIAEKEGRRVFGATVRELKSVLERERLSTDPRFGVWAARAEA